MMMPTVHTLGEVRLIARMRRLLERSSPAGTLDLFLNPNDATTLRKP